MLAALLVAAPSAAASSASLIRDINPGAGSSYPLMTGASDDGSQIIRAAGVGGELFFVASNPTHGSELWSSDGSTEGTTLVKDIIPGSDSRRISELTRVGDTLFFVASDGIHGPEVWRSDGTADGTSLVRDVNPGPGYVYPKELTNVGGTLYFVTPDGSHGAELWRSDGTAAGTSLVRDVFPGKRSSFPDQLTNVGGTLFFVARDGRNGYELRRSDGTADGTKLVRVIVPGAGNPDRGGNPYLNQLTNVGGTLFFVADDGTHGPELWRSDGTWAGTKMVRDIVPGSGSSDPYDLTNVGGTLFFVAWDAAHGIELWRSNGTEQGTTLVRDINPGSDSEWPYGNSWPSDLTDIGGTLLLVANDGTHGYELWRSDGTAQGTTMVRDILPGTDWLGSYPHQLTNVAGTLFFTADDEIHSSGATGDELWSSDGTATGTQLVRDIYPGDLGSGPDRLINVSGTLFFNADDGTHGRELWNAVP